MTGAYDPDRLRSRLVEVRLGRVFRVILRHVEFLEVLDDYRIVLTGPPAGRG